VIETATETAVHIPEATGGTRLATPTSWAQTVAPTSAGSLGIGRGKKMFWKEGNPGTGINNEGSRPTTHGPPGIGHSPGAETVKGGVAHRPTRRKGNCTKAKGRRDDPVRLKDAFPAVGEPKQVSNGGVPSGPQPVPAIETHWEWPAAGRTERRREARRTRRRPRFLIRSLLGETQALEWDGRG
jgi:hypothetical protein